MPSNLAKPSSVPTQRYPSRVWMVEMTEFCGKPSPVSQCLTENRGPGNAWSEVQKVTRKAAANASFHGFFTMPEGARNGSKSQSCCLLWAVCYELLGSARAFGDRVGTRQAEWIMDLTAK